MEQRLNTYVYFNIPANRAMHTCDKIYVHILSKLLGVYNSIFPRRGPYPF